MDEILIEEKKYISSKRASKVTGYAKDYIGQLCREGRVPARFVGRSWYVLETAIQDHRFGTPGGESEKTEKTVSRRPIQAAWEAPRYGAFSDDLPSVEGVESSGIDNSASAIDQGVENGVKSSPEDSWREWFEHFDRVANVKETIVSQEKEVEPSVSVESSEIEEHEKDEELPAIEEEEVSVPIHLLPQTGYQPPPEEFLPPRSMKITDDQQISPLRRKERRHNRALFGAIQVVGMVLAIISAVTAVVGSGFLDEYVLTNSQARMIAGVSLYNK